MTNLLSAVAALAATLGLLFWGWRRRAEAHNRAAAGDLLRPAMRLWAGLAPYESGNESAGNLEAAVHVAMGEAEHGRMLGLNLFRKHADAFKADPAEWNSLAASLVEELPRPSADVRMKFEEAIKFVLKFHLMMNKMQEGELDEEQARHLKGQVDAMEILFEGIADRVR
jgi:type I site-specific restriction endonuclease